MSYGMVGHGSITSRGRIFALPRSVQTCSGAQPAFYKISTGGDFPGVKWPEREADHSAPITPAVKNNGAIPLLPHASLWRVVQLLSTGQL